MKPATAKVKGRETENLFVGYLRRWVPHAERRRLTGTHDRGDIAGTPGICWEIKSGARLDLAGWLHELAAEVDNDQADHGILVIRPKGQPNPENWWAVLTLPDLISLLVEAEWLRDPTPDAATPPATDATPPADHAPDAPTTAHPSPAPHDADSHGSQSDDSPTSPRA